MTTSMQPVRPVVPVLRSTTGVDHEVRAYGHSPAVKTICGEPVNRNTWTVVAAYQVRNPCGRCARETL